MKENLFFAGIIYLHLVIYAIISLNADTGIQTNAHCPSQSHFRGIYQYHRKL